MHNPSNHDQKFNSDGCYHGILRLCLSLATCPRNVTFEQQDPVQNLSLHSVVMSLYRLHSGTLLQSSLDFHGFDTLEVCVMFPCD